MPTTLQQAIITSWSSMASWVANDLPGVVAASRLPNFTYQANLDVCGVLQSPLAAAAFADKGIGVLATGSWGSDGNGTVALQALSLTLAETSELPLVPDGSNVQVAIDFGTLQITGNFSFAQPCQRHEVGPNIKQTLTGSGTLAQTITGGQVVYTASLHDNGTITPVAATVNGKPQTKVNTVSHSAQSPAGDLDTKIADALDGGAMTTAIEAWIVTAAFTSQIFARLNQGIAETRVQNQGT